MSEHTPDKDSVEMHYVTGAVAANPGLTQIQARAEFARFLARVKRDAAREALDGLAATHDTQVLADFGIRNSSRIGQEARIYRDTHYGNGALPPGRAHLPPTRSSATVRGFSHARTPMSHFPIHIPGTPIPQGSKSATRTGVMYEANPKLRPWRATMTTHLTAWTGTWFGAWEPYDGPLTVDVTFTMPKPGRPKYQLPAVKPDPDKLCRALGDALTAAGVITDDARITAWCARKRYADEGREGVTIYDIRADTEP